MTQSPAPQTGGERPPPQTPAELFEELRRSPFLHSVRREFDAMFDRLHPGLAALLSSQSEPGPLIPATDVSETPEAMHVVVEVPGVARGDLEVTVSGSSLAIRGRKGAEHDEEGRDWHRTERRVGRFARTIPLGFEPEDGAVSARFEDGVLRVEIRRPPRAEASARHIEIA